MDLPASCVCTRIRGRTRTRHTTPSTCYPQHHVRNTARVSTGTSRVSGPQPHLHGHREHIVPRTSSLTIHSQSAQHIARHASALQHRAHNRTHTNYRRSPNITQTRPWLGSFKEAPWKIPESLAAKGRLCGDADDRREACGVVPGAESLGRGLGLCTGMLGRCLEGLGERDL
jgi:hypothetical protein